MAARGCVWVRGFCVRQIDRHRPLGQKGPRDCRNRIRAGQCRVGGVDWTPVRVHVSFVLCARPYPAKSSRTGAAKEICADSALSGEVAAVCIFLLTILLYRRELYRGIMDVGFVGA